MITKETLRDRIRGVSKRWDAQYPPDGRNGADKLEIGRKLRAMNLETASAAEVDAVIGNDSWTTGICCNCNNHTMGTTYTIGEVPDYESATATLCRECSKAFVEFVMNDTD